MDPYSAAHLTECQLRVTKALDAIYIYNAPQAGGGGMGPIIFGNVVPGTASAPAVQSTEAPVQIPVEQAPAKGVEGESK